MKINKSTAKYSAIVGIGENLKKKSIETGEEYLFLNRGINQVVNIDLSEIIPMLDFNSAKMQYYPNNKGLPELTEAINKTYFGDKTKTENIFITAGGMNALYLTYRTLDVKKVFTPAFFWGAYTNLFKICKIPHEYYESYNELYENPEKFKNSSIIICDPNNPLGDKFDDEKLIETVGLLEKHNVTVVWDGPYRKLFYDETDNIYERLLEFDNLIITDSFSKSVGLSGQRLGFMHSKNAEFNEEFSIRLLFSGNGINMFAQWAVERILTTPEGKKAALNFRTKTVLDIAKNIEFLKNHGFLAEEFYKDSSPLGIFVIINLNYEQLLEYNIGSVPLNYFTLKKNIDTNKYARICVSVPNEKFEYFFKKMIK